MSNEVRFEGSCRDCGNQEQHPVHVTGTYRTVRYGELEYFCLGSGPGSAHMKFSGSADSPAVARMATQPEIEAELASRARSREAAAKRAELKSAWEKRALEDSAKFAAVHLQEQAARRAQEAAQRAAVGRGPRKWA